jgi:hypothetical protein
MPAAVSLRPPDRTTWMNPQQCNGRYWPGTTGPDDLVIHTAATVNIDPERRLSNFSLPDPSTDGPSPLKLRRRASQGSLRTKPSPVSRFLSKGSVAIHFPSWEHRSSTPGSPFRVESRTRSADSRLRLSTTVSRGPRPLTGHSSHSGHSGHSHSSSPWNSPSSSPADYSSILPPTPPEDDSHVSWNPQSEMLLFDQQPHREPGPSAMMDDGPGVDTSPTTGPSDTLSSPSDGLSHGSSSSGGSPGPHDEMDCQQDVGSWLDQGINVTGKRHLPTCLLGALLTRPQFHHWEFPIHEETPSKLSRRHSHTRGRPISR